MGTHMTIAHFAGEVQRIRPLTEQETDMLCRALSRGKTQRTFWTAADDRRLVRMRRTMQAPEIAAKMGKSVSSVRSRLHKVKRKEMGR